MNDRQSAGIPPNPFPDPAASIKEKIGSISTALQDIGVDKSISDNLLSEITQRIDETGNKVASTVSGNYDSIISALDKMGINFKPEANRLDRYATYSYHLKFVMVSDANAKRVTDYKTYADLPKEVIAESGVTAGFNIKDFEIKNLCSPQQRIGISIETEWKMTLLEPYGLSFIDRLFTLSTGTFGMANHLKGIYFIEIWFRGYDDEGIDRDYGLYKLFRVIISEIAVDSNSSGSVYNITGVIDNTLAQSNEFAMTPAQIKVSDVTTFGQFWVLFREQLNELNKKVDYDLKATRAEYEFIMPKEWLSWKLTRKPQDNMSQSGFEIIGPADKPTITIPAGKAISEILVTVMSICEEGKKFTMGPPTAGKDSGNSSSREESEGIALIPLVQSKVEFLSYSYFFNDYKRKVTFYFSKYPTVRSYKNREFIAHSQKPEVQKSRLQEFVRDARLKKVYNYQFTGLNTDIIRFDIKLDNYWTAMQPLFDGYNSGTLWSLGPSVPGDSMPTSILSEYKKAVSDMQTAKARISELEAIDKNNRDVGYINELITAQELFRQAETTWNQWKNKINLDDFEIKFGLGSPGEKSIAGIIINNIDMLKDPTIRRDIVSRIVYNLTRSSAKDRYLESIQPDDPRNNPLPISTFISNSKNQQNNQTGVLGISEPLATTSIAPPKSRGLLAAIIDNVTGSQFLNIELEIRGDPYWLGIDNIQNLPYLDPNTPPPKVLGNQSALFGTGECAFLLFFRTGEEPDESTGLVEFNSSSWAFNGLYVVTEVDNYFRDGKFTQVLHANKDCALYSVWNSLAAESKSK